MSSFSIGEEEDDGRVILLFIFDCLGIHPLYGLEARESVTVGCYEILKVVRVLGVE